MPRLVPKGAPDSRPLEVSDEAVESWTALGYVEVQDKKPAAKKSSARKSTSSKK